MPVIQQVRTFWHGIQHIQNRPVDNNIAGIREKDLVEPAGYTANEINDPAMRSHSI